MTQFGDYDSNYVQPDKMASPTGKTLPAGTAWRQWLA